MRPNGTAKALEQRRRKALELLEQGFSLNEVARRIGCNASSVMRWRDAYNTSGPEGLKPKPTPGRPVKLKPRQQKALVNHLLKGAMAHGYATDLWTTQRIAELIERKYTITYHRDHIGRLMHDLGWSHQKPERRACERKEKDIETWKREKWPQVKKTLRGWAPTSSS
jgi:transposase